MGYLINNSTGARYDLQDGLSAPNGAMTLSDLLTKYGASAANPVDYMGQKGYMTPDGNVVGLDANGRPWQATTGVDYAASMKRQAEQLAMDEKRQKIAEGNIDKNLKLAQLAEKAGIDPAQLFGGNAQRSKYGRPPSGVSLGKGEIYNNETGQVEQIPGSDAYIKQSGKHQKDLDAMNAVADKTTAAINKIGEIEKDKSGFESNFGGYNALLSQYFPGAATDTRKKIESLKSDLKMAGLEMIRSGGSIGQMTEKEWPIVEQMVAAISPTLSEEEAAFQLAKVKTYMQNIAKRASESYANEWGGSQYAKPKSNQGGNAGNMTPMDAEAWHWAKRNPNDPRAAAIFKKLGVQ